MHDRDELLSFLLETLQFWWSLFFYSEKNLFSYDKSFILMNFILLFWKTFTLMNFILSKFYSEEKLSVRWRNFFHKNFYFDKKKVLFWWILFFIQDKLLFLTIKSTLIKMDFGLFSKLKEYLTVLTVVLFVANQTEFHLVHNQKKTVSMITLSTKRIRNFHLYLNLKGSLGHVFGKK